MIHEEDKNKFEPRIDILEDRIKCLEDIISAYWEVEKKRNLNLLMNFNRLDSVLDKLGKSIENIQNGLEEEGFLS